MRHFSDFHAYARRNLSFPPERNEPIGCNLTDYRTNVPSIRI